MTPAVRNVILSAPFSPYRLPGIAARYDLSNLSSLVYDGSNRVQLVADLSGNSATNVLAGLGVASNSATSPDSAALSITGDIDIRSFVSADDWTPAGIKNLVNKLQGGGQSSYDFYVNSSTAGTLVLRWSEDGTALKSATSTAAVPFTDFTAGWVRVTLDVDNGAAGSDAKFYTSTDGVNWTQLGNTVTGVGTTSIFNGTTALTLGADAANSRFWSGLYYRCQIYNGIAGTLAFDANFSLVAKLATSFTESSSNAATVTINTSGDTGARICGARDLVQMTQAKQPILTIAAGGNFATFDGSNDFIKSAPFSLSQPESVYFVGSQVTWSTNDTIFDGHAGDSMEVLQRTTTPNLAMYAGSFGGETAALAVATRGLLSAVFNGASSSLRLNKGALNTGNCGASNGGGFTVGAIGGGASNLGNITACEMAVFSVAHDLSTQDRNATFFIRKWGIP